MTLFIIWAAKFDNENESIKSHTIKLIRIKKALISDLRLPKNNLAFSLLKTSGKADSLTNNKCRKHLKLPQLK